MISCLSEEIESSPNYFPILSRIERLSFEGGSLTERMIIKFNSNKPTFASFYDNYGQLKSIIKWSYFKNNYLSSIKAYLPDGTSTLETNIIYDSENRIVKTERKDKKGIYLSISNFKYNKDNTITCYTERGKKLSSKLFVVNNRGMIEKELVNGNVNVLVEYDNFSPVKLKTFSDTYTYKYMEKGYFPFSFDKILGSSKVNLILFNNSIENTLIQDLSVRLPIKILSKSETEDYVYILNQYNLPVTKKYYYNGNLHSEYYYSYK